MGPVVLRALHVRTENILSNPVEGNLILSSYYNGVIEAQRSGVICSRSQSSVLELSPKPSEDCTWTCTLHTCLKSIPGLGGAAEWWGQQG